MKRPAILIAIVAGGIAVIATGVVLAGVLPFSSQENSGRPPCSQLPPKQDVVKALDSHADLTARIKDVGSGVTVNIGTPCDDPNLALVSIHYKTDGERSGVHDILQTSDGFGVPAELLKKD